ncbi:hypothetical protein MNBD_GAMMA25-1403 [hydrothermal vent metagenome]|uniref:Uncharacterized protein n=1 Tax=hydrothermal vent metagenome TaxID=652676 RepID=A0A3B1BEI8_9ZZZZ
MHAVQVYIEETLNASRLQDVKNIMLTIPHVHNVEFNNKIPHDMLVEFDANHNVPIMIVEKLESEGIHPDIISA